MKTLFFFILFLYATITCIAQPETGKKSKSFPILEMPKAEPIAKKPFDNPFSNPTSVNQEPLFTPNNNPFSEKKKPSFVIGEIKKINLSETNKFENPNINIVKILNEKFKQHDLGQFILNSDFVIVRCRDYDAVDGDKISIFFNSEIIESKISLTSEFKDFKVPLIVGVNKIEFYAINEGTGSPNTAEFQILDQTNKLLYENKWSLLIGEKGRVIITIEK